jgi:ornithine cyclodeaminase/alanine dehydrogenase-like protein (mu-crystallin family)
MADWVLAAERAYVAAAVGRHSPEADARAPGDGATQPSNVQPDMAAAATQPPNRQTYAIAAAGAVASRYLAVGTPRSFGILIDDATDVAAAVLSLTAHRTWFDPRDVRCAATTTGAAELAAATGGRVVSLDEALACDIVNVYSTRVRIAPTQLRRGTHVNTVSAEVFDPELLTLATVVHEAGLPALAAGLVDGRQLDELTIFAIDGAPIAATAAADPV